MTFQWQRPRTIGLDGATLAKAKTYEAAHSLPGEPYDVEPPVDQRARVLALTHLAPILPPCEDAPPPEDDWYKADINCITCEDSPKGICVGEWGIWMPCPDCPGPVDDRPEELFWDMEAGK